MKQKIIAISLFGLWLLQCVLPAIVYYSGRWHYHLENFAPCSPNKKNFTIKFTASEKINWEVDEKEFEMNGVLYDVISISKNATCITIQCCADKEETKLTDGYHDYIKDKTKKNKSGHSIKKIVDKQLINNKITFWAFTCFNKIIPSAIKNSLETGKAEIHPPPPKCIS